MLYYLSQWILEQTSGSPWGETLSPLRLFRYITVRSAGAATTALLLSWWLGPPVIAWLRRLRFGQEYRDRAEEAGGFDTRILEKRGTPTMGGILIIAVLNLSALLWAQWNELLLLTLLSTAVLCGLGFYDDYAKITRQASGGASSWVKLTVQTVLALFIGAYLWMLPGSSTLVTEVVLPFAKRGEPVLTGAGLIGMGVILFTIVGSSNAVNLTDGLDGLAIGCTVIVSFVLLVLTYVAGNFGMAEYLQVPYVPGAGELSVFCAALIGAGLGFLWYNCHPARVFMGDTGSLALGGALGIIAVLIHQPFVLVIAGGVFVLEALSVLLQTGWFKYTRFRHGSGRRIFLMAPLHHHFEKKGWYESQVVMRFYILGILFGVVALMTLKIR
jgi:phospho-N-acetylmuramoyl-pentapeptide-transferase